MSEIEQRLELIKNLQIDLDNICKLFPNVKFCPTLKDELYCLYPKLIFFFSILDSEQEILKYITENTESDLRISLEQEFERVKNSTEISDHAKMAYQVSLTYYEKNHKFVAELSSFLIIKILKQLKPEVAENFIYNTDLMNFIEKDLSDLLFHIEFCWNVGGTN